MQKRSSGLIKWQTEGLLIHDPPHSPKSWCPSCQLLTAWTNKDFQKDKDPHSWPLKHPKFRNTVKRSNTFRREQSSALSSRVGQAMLPSAHVWAGMPNKNHSPAGYLAPVWIL